MDSLNDDIESILYIGREVSVYRIPPLKANEGYRAGDWGDLAAPLWKGRLRIVQKSSTPNLDMIFEDPTTGDLFVKAEYDPMKPGVEAVLDSSRYFVIRVEEAGKKAYIGMGFAERTDSFDFNVAIQDYTKRHRASLQPPSPTEEETPSPHVPTGPKKDYSLKEGQTFSINIPGRNKSSTGSSSKSDSGDLLGNGGSSSGGGIPLLAPPPSGGGLLPPPPSGKRR